MMRKCCAIAMIGKAQEGQARSKSLLAESKKTFVFEGKSVEKIATGSIRCGASGVIYIMKALPQIVR